MGRAQSEVDAGISSLRTAADAEDAGEPSGGDVGETDQKLGRAIFAHLDAAWADWSRENVVWVGAGEMNCEKGSNYPTAFVDLEAK